MPSVCIAQANGASFLPQVDDNLQVQSPTALSSGNCDSDISSHEPDYVANSANSDEIPGRLLSGINLQKQVAGGSLAISTRKQKKNFLDHVFIVGHFKPTYTDISCPNIKLKKRSRRP